MILLLAILFQHQDINFEYFPHFLEKPFGCRDKLFPVGVFVAHKTPIQPEQEIEKEQVRRSEVDISYPTHNVLVRSIFVAHERQRVRDIKACNN